MGNASSTGDELLHALAVGATGKNFVVNLEKFNENKQVRKIKYVCFAEEFFFSVLTIV